MYLDSFPFVTVDIRFKTTELIWEQQSNSRQKTVVYYDFLLGSCVWERVHVCAFCAAATLKRIWERNTRQDQKAIVSGAFRVYSETYGLFFCLSFARSLCVFLWNLNVLCVYEWCLCSTSVFHSVRVYLCETFVARLCVCMFEPIHFNANASFLSFSVWSSCCPHVCWCRWRICRNVSLLLTSSLYAQYVTLFAHTLEK